MSEQSRYSYVQHTLELDFETSSTLPTPYDEAKESRQLRRLRLALRPYIDTKALRRLVTENSNLYQALRHPTPPIEVTDLLTTLQAVLTPSPRDQIRSPVDAVGLMMTEMMYLDQEHFRTIMLDTKNRVLDITTVYIGSVNSSLIRVGEVYKEAVRRNSVAVIVCHNHPSGDPTPSPEDTIVTREIVEAGKILDIECLDHLVIGHGKYVSMRERGLGFSV